MEHIRETLDDLGYKPIPTEYKGITYRSRLEARWAIFLEEIGVEAYYEFEGFQLPRGWYVPDFWLPRLDCWLEIKPVSAHHDLRAYNLFEDLLAATDSHGFMAFGPPVGYEEWSQEESPYLVACWNDGCTDFPYFFTACDKCGAVGIQFEGRGDRVCGTYCHPDTDRGHNWPESFERARLKALRTQFWKVAKRA